MRSVLRRRLSVAFASKKRASLIDALALEQLADLGHAGARRDPDRYPGALLVRALERLEGLVDGVQRRADGGEREQGEEAAEPALGLGRRRRQAGAPGAPDPLGARGARQRRALGDRLAAARRRKGVGGLGGVAVARAGVLRLGLRLEARRELAAGPPGGSFLRRALSFLGCAISHYSSPTPGKSDVSRSRNPSSRTAAARESSAAAPARCWAMRVVKRSS